MTAEVMSNGIMRKCRAERDCDEGRGTTVEGDALRSRGRFLRGMAWHELGTAQAKALESEAVIAWNRAVRADYEQYLAGRALRSAAKKGGANERVEEAAP